MPGVHDYVTQAIYFLPQLNDELENIYRILSDTVVIVNIVVFYKKNDNSEEPKDNVFVS